jgi:hypothetical protein
VDGSICKSNTVAMQLGAIRDAGMLVARGGGQLTVHEGKVGNVQVGAVRNEEHAGTKDGLHVRPFSVTTVFMVTPVRERERGGGGVPKRHDIGSYDRFYLYVGLE